MKKIDYKTLDRAGWENVGKSLADAPTKTWLNIGQWLNAGDRFFANSKGCDEKMLIGTARQMITTVDERTLRMYRETERKTRDARGRMAENGFPIDKQFIFFHHVKDLAVDDQVMFIVEKRAWTNHTEFSVAVDAFNEIIKDKPDVDHAAAFADAYALIERARKDKPAQKKLDKGKVKVTVLLTKEIHAIVEWLAVKDETTVANILADAAYNMALDNETDYRAANKLADAAAEQATKVERLQTSIGKGEAAVTKLQAERQQYLADIEKSLSTETTTALQRAIENKDKAIKTTENTLAELRGELAALTSQEVTQVAPSTEATSCETTATA